MFALMSSCWPPCLRTNAPSSRPPPPPSARLASRFRWRSDVVSRTPPVADNSAALRRARRSDSRVKRQRAAEAIHTLEQSGESISFPAVARRASVSVSLLYTDSELAARIAAARDRQQQAGRQRAWHLPVRSLVTDQSVRAELANSKEHLRQLTEELTLLQDRLAHQFGGDADVARGWDVSPMLARLEQRGTHSSEPLTSISLGHPQRTAAIIGSPSRSAQDAIPTWEVNATLLFRSVSYTHLRAHETVLDLVCRLLLDKKQ